LTKTKWIVGLVVFVAQGNGLFKMEKLGATCVGFRNPFARPIFVNIFFAEGLKRFATKIIVRS
jgi:hypothetical protein